MRARWVVAGAVVVGLAGAGYTFVSTTEPEAAFCTTEGLIGPDGEIYGRSQSHSCQFVNDDGQLLLYLPDGTPICYDDGQIVACDAPGARPPS